METLLQLAGRGVSRHSFDALCGSHNGNPTSNLESEDSGNRDIYTELGRLVSQFTLVSTHRVLVATHHRPHGIYHAVPIITEQRARQSKGILKHLFPVGQFRVCTR